MDGIEELILMIITVEPSGTQIDEQIMPGIASCSSQMSKIKKGFIVASTGQSELLLPI